MDDRIIEDAREGMTLSTDRRRLDRDVLLAMLRASHWGGAMTAAVLERAIQNSVCVGVYRGERQVGFARAVSDLATYAYLTDVIVVEDARGQGIGKWMMQCIMTHPDLQGLRRIALWTRNARSFYEELGFSTDLPPASTYMEIRAK